MGSGCGSVDRAVASNIRGCGSNPVIGVVNRQSDLKIGLSFDDVLND